MLKNRDKKEGKKRMKTEREKERRIILSREVLEYTRISCSFFSEKES